MNKDCIPYLAPLKALDFVGLESWITRECRTDIHQPALQSKLVLEGKLDEALEGESLSFICTY